MASARLAVHLEYLRAACAATSLVAAAACPAVAQPAAAIVIEQEQRSPESPLESLVTRARRSVVQVVATTYGITPGDGLQHVERLVGAGVVVDAEGYILTGAQIVAGARRVEVVVADADATGRVLQADVVGSAPELDVALLRVRGAGLPALSLATRMVQEGDMAITVAYAADRPETVAAGVVLASGAPVREGSPMPYLITDAPASSAGAPVIDTRGEIVGLAAGFASAPDASPVTAAVPAALLRAAIEQMRAGDAFRRGVVGLAARSVAASEGGTPSGRALLIVSSVAAGLPADRAGVRAGDVIVAVGDTPVDGMALATLYLALYTLREGQSLALTIDRGGERLEIRPTAVSVVDVLASR
jgi:S1-C subfamily serine protease